MGYARRKPKLDSTYKPIDASTLMPTATCRNRKRTTVLVPFKIIIVPLEFPKEFAAFFFPADDLVHG
jgi:hypothetical protein